MSLFRGKGHGFQTKETQSAIIKSMYKRKVRTAQRRRTVSVGLQADMENPVHPQGEAEHIFRVHPSSAAYKKFLKEVPSNWTINREEYTL